ncbi:VOC family protein [Actinopolymorpha sp. B11F2]|uniref:VOC family protein n=1 Tax=Actinopolymorpha sp. B11F2 TaxID=3160862 RepID=UPI0032E4B177
MSNRAFPIISVGDLSSARRFYEQLGFTQVYQFPPEGEPGFVTMERGSSSIGIGAGSATDADRFGYWVYVDDVDATLQSLAAAGTPVVAEPEDQPWGERVDQTRDPDGNLVYLGAQWRPERRGAHRVLQSPLEPAVPQTDGSSSCTGNLRQRDAGAEWTSSSPPATWQTTIVPHLQPPQAEPLSGAVVDVAGC